MVCNYSGGHMQLPKSAQEIADVIGREQALLLINSLPRAYTLKKSGSAGSSTRGSGKRTPQATVIMYVPTVSRLNANHEFIRILGWNDAIKLCKAFGGEIMYPAMCADVQRDARNRRIHQLAGEGMAHRAIAEAVKVSERTVKNVLREKPPEEERAAANDNAADQIRARAE
jgi:hypothetical protein